MAFSFNSEVSLKHSGNREAMLLLPCAVKGTNQSTRKTLYTGLVYANGIYSRLGEYFSLGTDTEGNNCFSIWPVRGIDIENFSFKCSKIVKNVSYLKKLRASLRMNAKK